MSNLPAHVLRNIETIRTLAHQAHIRQIEHREDYEPKAVRLLSNALRVQLGRGAGHTTAIQTLATASDLVLCATHHMAREYKQQGCKASVGVLPTWQYMGQRVRYSRIWIDAGGVRGAEPYLPLYKALSYGAVDADCLIILGECL